MGESASLRRVGNSGLAVSVVGLGTNNFGMKLDLEQSRAVLHAALDHGINLIDTADSYGESERRIGEIVQGTRDDVVIATKFGSDVRRLGGDNGEDWGARGSRRYIRRAVEQSLRRLRTDWIDLYQLHRPDPATPIEETPSALDDLVHEGKIRYLGHSNFTGWQTADAEWTARTRRLERFISAQNEYSLLRRGIEADLVPALEHYGIGLLPYFPLASGLLTGKYKRGVPAPEGSRIQAWGRESALTDAAFDIVEQLEDFAAQRSITVLDVAIGGLAAQPAVSSVIAGATSPEQVEANVRAGRWQPTAEDLAEIDRITSVSR
ncbi:MULTISPECIES: aldo/keto reductase [Nocardia]|uniref:aldo/keto reductase n=1 Tax=Nocardia TaxID=1817 RepID=UPI0007E9E0E0|nr:MULTISPECIES: aldo/keto reductase [Nocardia]MBF6274505.1 aldo/keto reductase [Nocardia nova]OBA49157.1 aldo/keto reductase [Nocardia sp. 852002-51101_SCH5132738]OBB42221.1 aldo/keto reductase [Nocardia sp. 852002-51244_SCH5132740]OBF65235.1 aldo/keto reductase [Mycobacterium sp. 852002-51759_SCH5129042]